MKFRIFFIGFLSVFLLITSVNVALACESCAVPRLGRNELGCECGKSATWFADFTFEQQKWEEMSANDAHTLHHQGHHVHVKTHEEFYHLNVGMNVNDALTLMADIPYVVRQSVEIHSHRYLGAKQESEGFGDALFIGTYRFYRAEDGFLGVSAGIKTPTGSTRELNLQGERFEAELQPGTGSYDFPVGMIYQWRFAPSWLLRGNTAYVIKTEGDQNYEFGDLVTTSLFLDRMFSLDTQGVYHLTVGIDMNYQHEAKDREDGQRIDDTGANTLLLGPNVNLSISDTVSLFGAVLFPVAQQRGGVHQDLDLVWTAGAQVRW